MVTSSQKFGCRTELIIITRYKNGIEAKISEFEFWNDQTDDTGAATYTATFASDEWGENVNAKIGVSATYTDEKATLLTASLGSSADATNNGADLDTTNEKLGTGCLDFNGSSDTLVSNDLVNSMTTTGTISLWVMFEDIAANEVVWCFGDTNAESFIKKFIENLADLRLGVYCKSAGAGKWLLNSADDAISEDTWYHIVVTHDGTSPKLYVNGVDQTYNWQIESEVGKTFWVSTTSGLDNILIGAKSYESNISLYSDIKVDDVGIWNVALTSTQVNQLYDNNDSTAQLASVIPTGLRAHYNCDSATVTNNFVKSLLPENTLFEETDTKYTWWLQDDEWAMNFISRSTAMIMQ